MHISPTDRDSGSEDSGQNTINAKREAAIEYIYSELDNVIHRVVRAREGDLSKGMLIKRYRLDDQTAEAEMERLPREYPDKWELLEGILQNGRRGKFLRYK